MKSLAVCFAVPVLTLALGSFASAQTTTPCSSGWTPIIEDSQTYKVYPAPSASPSNLPPAGSTWADPTFHTCMMRVTDATDTPGDTPNTGEGYGCKNYYSYWPTLNANSTLGYVNCDYVANGSNNNVNHIFGLDPVNFKLGERGTVTWEINSEDAIWSSVLPDTIFGHTGSKIESYQITSSGSGFAATQNWVVDLSSMLNGLTLAQMSKSADDDKFAFTLLDSNGNHRGFLVYSRSLGKFVTGQINSDEFHIDKTGGYLAANSVQGITNVEDRVYEIIDDGTSLSVGNHEDLTNCAPDYDFDHSDYGSNMVVGVEDCTPSTTFRYLSTPHTYTTILPPFPLPGGGTDWSLSWHVSTLADDESWATHGSYVSNNLRSSGIMANEIDMVATDGSTRAARLAHHQSVYSDYWSSPRPNISKDGKFIAFTSNWGLSNGRLDVFLLQVPQLTPTVTVSSASVPDATVGKSYYAKVLATGGSPGYSFSLAQGSSLPAGLLLANTGEITGTPAAAGRSQSFTVQVADSLQAVATRSLTINVNAAFAITTASPLPAGTLNQSYSTNINTSGGASPDVFSVASGSLPPGLSLNASTGALSGTPSAAGTFSFTISATDAQFSLASQGYSMTVNPPPAGAPDAPTRLRATAGRGSVTLSWKQSISPGINGNKIYRATVNGGPYQPIATIPAGISYTDNAVAGGTTYYYVVTAVNGAGESPYSNQASARPR